MAFIGKVPTPVPLTSADITDGIISTAKISNNAVSVAKLTSTLDLSSNTVTLPSGVGGKVLQVVTATDDTVRTTTSTSFVSGSLSVNITPSSSSNKVFVMTSGTCYYDGTNKRYRVTIYRDSTNLDGDGSNGLIQGFTSGGNIVGSMNMNILDTPSTSSQITYAVYFRADDTGGNTAYLGEYNVRKSITAFEISG